MELFILFVLILLNGFFALSEIALVSSKKTKLEQLKAEGSRGAKIALDLLSEAENFLSAIQVGITLISILIGVYGGVSIADDVTPFFEQNSYTAPYASEVALTLTVLTITYVSIVIGELVPKSIALSNPEKFAKWVAPVIFYFSKIFFPFVKLLSFSTTFVLNLLGIKKHKEQFSEEELRQLIKTASVQGLIEQDQNRIYENIFYFSDKRAKHIMTHRTDVEWINIDKPLNEIQSDLSKFKHGKVVCSKGELDHFKGILNLGDFYQSLSLNGDIKIDDLVKPVLVVPENTHAQEVLSLFRQNKEHICCVVNEFGGFEGVITLHDIIENIVGEIPDEGMALDSNVFRRDDGSILVSGDAPIETLAELIANHSIDFEKIDYSTVAGFVLNKINRIPKIGDHFDYKGYRIEVIDVDGKRIDKILVSKK